MIETKTDHVHRRDVLLGGVCIGVLSCTPSLARSAPAHTLFDQLSKRLKAHPLPVSPAKIHLLNLDSEPQGRGAMLRAVVRLEWPPGLRQHIVTTHALSEADALEQITLQILDLFDIVA